jgi:hypothetical protein
MSFLRPWRFLASGLLLGTFCVAGLPANAQQTAVAIPVSISTSSSGVLTDELAPAYAVNREVAALPDDPGIARRQQAAVAEGSPMPSSGARQESDDSLAEGRQTRRILYVVPNFRAVSAQQQLPPQPVKDKFITVTEDSFDYSSFIFVGAQSGLSFWRKSYPEFHQGAAGYGRYYWHTFADQADENLWVEFILPSVLHQDSRYYTLGTGGFRKRFVYSFTRVGLTRTDEGHHAFNASEIVGAGAAAGISNFYYPTQERTLVKTYQRWVTNIVIDGGTFVFKEFWPDLNNRFFHQTDD